MPADHLRCQLYLVAETDAHGRGLEELEAVLAAGGEAVASVLLRPRSGGTLAHGELQSAIQRLQTRGLAVLIADDAELARHLGADGVHLYALHDEGEARARYAIARAMLGSDRTVGASAGVSRHLAMVLGEIGADYVAFETGPDDARDRVAELAIWWAPLFEVPVVAMGIESAAEADRLAAAGVDFLGVAVSGLPKDAQTQHVARLAAAISTGEIVP
ncbi:MAG: thiamine phosphate synthase [Hyphomicrobiaceae bacterium]